MSKDSGATSKRVLLTSSLPKPQVSPLATLMHDARNKLTAIVSGLAERRDCLQESRFEAMMTMLDGIRDRTQEILRAARLGTVDYEPLPHDLNRMRSDIKVVYSAIQRVEDQGWCVPLSSVRVATAGFDGLMEDSLRYVEKRSVETVPEYGNITGFIAIIVQAYKEQYPHIHFNLDAEMDIYTSFCPSSIKRALENLLNNAIQALPKANGQITIKLNEMYYGSTERPFAEIEEGIYDILEISDNGSGIPDDILDQLPHSSITTKENGSGVGLVSARESILQHRGHLFVESEEGQGSKVTALLPSKCPPRARLPRIRK